MPKYEIIYAPKSAALLADLETEIEADYHRVEGRFIAFYRKDSDEPYATSSVVLRVAAAHILQVKTLDASD